MLDCFIKLNELNNLTTVNSNQEYFFLPHSYNTTLYNIMRPCTCGWKKTDIRAGQIKCHELNWHRSLKRPSQTKHRLNSSRRMVRQRVPMNQLDQRTDPQVLLFSAKRPHSPLRAFMCFLARGNSSTRSVEASIAPKTLNQRLICEVRDMTGVRHAVNSTSYCLICAHFGIA